MRWTLRIFTLLSFLLLAQSLALWVRSYVLIDFIHHQQVQRFGSILVHNHRMLTNYRGQLGVMTKRSTWILPHPEVQEEQISAIPRGFSHERLTGFISNTLGIAKPA